MIVLDLIYNLSLLVALSVVSGFIDSHLRRSTTGTLSQGLLFGAIAVIGMYYPFVLSEGIIFDGRSIVISLGTLLFGPLAGVVSALIATAYRLYLGGAGAFTGVMVIVSSYLIGWWFHRWKNRRPSAALNWKKLYIMGLVVHLVMLLLMFTLPSANIADVVRTIFVTLLLVYPVITVIIGKIFIDHEASANTLERLKHQEEQLRLIVESTNDVIFTLDRTQRYTAIYGTWMQEFGLSPAVFIGKRHREVGVDDNGDLHEAMNALALAGRDVTYEWSVQAPQGEEHYQTKLAPIRTTDGEIIGLVGVSRNVTDLKNAEAVLKAQLRKLSEITWIQSHEVRAPVARIMSLAELLRSPSQTETDIAKISGYLMESAEELDRLIRNIVETAKEQR